jgi:deazaflavin-dependent oxidoreductase (nitroreductase family)
MPTTPRDRFNRARDRMVRALYRRTDGRFGAKVGPARILLLTTTGRRTGRPHTVPLVYVEDEAGRWAVTASNAGQGHHPSWYLNLSESWEAEAQVGDETVPVRARVAEGAERDALWPKFVSVFRGYATYARRASARASREIPVVVLERR